MRSFHISDILTVTTGRLVSTRHIDGVYDILNFLTGDSLFTHQLPRAMKECEPWLRSQFPALMEDAPVVVAALAEMDTKIAGGVRDAAIHEFVSRIQRELDLPEMIPVYELSAEMHTHIDPVEELRAMVGDDRVIVIDATEVQRAK